MVRVAINVRNKKDLIFKSRLKNLLKHNKKTNRLNNTDVFKFLHDWDIEAYDLNVKLEKIYSTLKNDQITLLKKI